MHKALLSFDKVSKLFYQGSDRVHLFNHISATFVQGYNYAIMGVSGTGKSTFLQLLAGLDKPTSGTITYNGQSLAHFSATQYHYFLCHDVGLVFQSPYLLRELSVLENVMMKGLIAGMDMQECQHEALALLNKVNLEAYAQRYPATLSGGEQQRVALARALMLKPSFLLADEPTAHLDEMTRVGIVELMKDCCTTWSMGIILTTHDTAVANMMDTIIKIHEGDLIIKKGVLP